MKRFEEKLDEYYTKKYIECLEDFIFIQWDLDFKINNKDDRIEIYAKNRKYINCYYELLFSVKKNKALYYICNFEKDEKIINDIIKKYSKENK